MLLRGFKFAVMWAWGMSDEQEEGGQATEARITIRVLSGAVIYFTKHSGFHGDSWMSQFLFERFQNCLTAVILYNFWVLLSGGCSAASSASSHGGLSESHLQKILQKWLWITPILNKNGGSTIFLWFLEDILIWLSARLTHLPCSKVALKPFLQTSNLSSIGPWLSASMFRGCHLHLKDASCRVKAR